MPVKCPCEICLRPCKRNQCAIQCDMCDEWIHLKCTVISPLKFHTLCSSTEPYLCQNCYSELFPFQNLDDKQLLNEMRNDDCYVVSAAEGIEPGLVCLCRVGYRCSLYCCLHVTFHLTISSQFALCPLQC